MHGITRRLSGQGEPCLNGDPFKEWLTDQQSRSALRFSPARIPIELRRLYLPTCGGAYGSVFDRFPPGFPYLFSFDRDQFRGKLREAIAEIALREET
jgi:hypothetical protein